MTGHRGDVKCRHMAKPDSDLFRRGTYHHGNLREALLAAARDLIAERGPAGFTLVEAARRAGAVSTAAYWQFQGPERGGGVSRGALSACQAPRRARGRNLPPRVRGIRQTPPRRLGPGRSRSAPRL